MTIRILLITLRVRMVRVGSGRWRRLNKHTHKHIQWTMTWQPYHWPAKQTHTQTYSVESQWQPYHWPAKQMHTQTYSVDNDNHITGQLNKYTHKHIQWNLNDNRITGQLNKRTHKHIQWNLSIPLAAIIYFSSSNWSLCLSSAASVALCRLLYSGEEKNTVKTFNPGPLSQYSIRCLRVAGIEGVYYT